jgi:hypothetical protein
MGVAIEQAASIGEYVGVGVGKDTGVKDQRSE